MPRRQHVVPSGRSYGQFCGLARALDVLGDRWTLLIVRELLIAPRRYTDLKDALPGAASNLIVRRLRDLQRDGLVQARDVPPPTPARVYSLTPLGAELEEAVIALTRWGGHRMRGGRGGDLFHPDWLVVALRAALGPSARVPMEDFAVVVEVDGAPVTLSVRGRRIVTALGADARADAVLHADAEAILMCAAGAAGFTQLVRDKRIVVDGPAGARRRLALLFGPPVTAS